MRARVSWVVMLAVFLAFPPFQRERVEEMGFGGIFRIERMRADSALTQALRSRWDAEVTAFVFPWGHMIPSLEDVSRITGLRIYGRPVSRHTYPCYHDLAERLLELPVERRLTRVSRRELASELGAQANLDLRHFLVLFLGRLLFATRGDAVHCRFLPLLEDVVWQPYLGEGDEGQPWLVQARPYFGRAVWLHALNLVIPLHLHLSQRSLGLRQSVVEFPVRDSFRRPGRSFRGLHDTTDWRERTKEKINNWEHKGKAVKSTATTDDAYLQAYALKYGGKVDVAGEIASLRALLYSAVQDREAAQRQTAELRRELERVRSTGAGSASSLRGAGSSPSLLEAQLVGAVLRAEEAQRHLQERERDLQFTTEHAMDLQGERDRLRGEVQTTRSERDQLHIWAKAAEAQVAEATKELAALRLQRSPGDQEEVTRLRAELLAQQTVARSLQQIVTDIGCSRSRSRSGASASRATGGSVGQYLAGSSSRRRNEEEERHRQGDGSARAVGVAAICRHHRTGRRDPGRVAVDTEETLWKSWRGFDQNASGYHIESPGPDQFLPYLAAAGCWFVGPVDLAWARMR
ncbi:hypothetical protein Taro_050198 [Colocasia esculenta]|uniref:Aminotransferase-like plant mobile domain-containing protein n=1 Tax=Colocasia esculenta TaxID=4460 RepID=A0A843XCS5_COLES|nr:hypothetical protein [Colocasia esculenta]